MRWMCFWVGLLCVACVAKTPAVRIESGPAISVDTFDTGANWDEITGDTLIMRVAEGAFRAYSTLANRYAWVMNRVTHTDVIIQTNVYNLASYERGIYGVICRAGVANDGTGYYFLLTTNGQASIRKGLDRRQEFTALLDWQRVPAIHLDGRVNVILAICADDYLALYINDVFVGDVRDRAYQTGYAGMVIGMAGSGVTDVAFDQLSIWEAQIIAP